MILNKYIELLAEPRLVFPALTINFALFRKQLAFLQHRLPYKTQVNSMRAKETLVDAPHKAVEKEVLVNGT